MDYVGVLRDRSVSPYWDNASLPAAAARLFTENTYARNVATLPWMVAVGYALGISAIFLTAMRVRHGPEVGLWVLVAASLLASPIAWHNYLVLLGPGVAGHPGAVAPALVREGHGRGLAGAHALPVHPGRALARPPGRDERTGRRSPGGGEHVRVTSLPFGYRG